MNAHLSNPDVTREMIDRAAEEIDAERAAAQPTRLICDTHHIGGGAYYKDECPSCRAAAQPEEEPPSDWPMDDGNPESWM